MAKDIHCPTCGFVMMIEVQGSTMNYICVNTHDAVIKDEGELGPNLDILMEFLKRP